jgi:hypothetical protein
MKRVVIISAVLLLLTLSFASAGILESIENFITGKVSSQSQNVSITVAGANPVVVEVPTLSINPIEENPVTVLFTANVSDADGVNDIDDSSVIVAINGPITRTGSCAWISDISSTKAQYNCSVVMWYFDPAGIFWTLNVSATDFGDGTLVSGTAVFTYGEVKGMLISPSALTWPTVTTGAANQQASNDPTIINNTGNYNGAVSITALDLQGETISTESIPASSFTTGAASGSECTATALVNSVSTSISGSNSNPGNLSLGGGVGQEQLYYCIPLVPSVSSQVYSTAAGGSWIVSY